MRPLLLLLLLFVSFARRSFQLKLDKNEAFFDFNTGFPPGSLLTVYLSFVPQPSHQENTFAINLYENFAAGVGDHLHFRFVGTWDVFHSTYRVLPGGWITTNEKRHSAWLPPLGTNPGTGARMIRFDLYRIDDTTFLPFHQGFNAKRRTMPVTDKFNTVHIRPAVDNQATPNFDVDDVYCSHKLPNQYSPKAEMVLAALDQKIVSTDRAKKTEFAKLDKFAIGTKIRLSALMISSGVKAAEDKPENEDKNFAALLFLNKDNKLAFGFFNKYSAADKKVKLYLIAEQIPDELNLTLAEETKLYLIAEQIPNELNLTSEQIPDELNSTLAEETKGQGNEVDCTGDGPSSTDIVHVMLTRPDSKTIEMRIFYVGKPSGTECKITLPVEQEKYLDGPLTIKGVQSATLLHMNVV